MAADFIDELVACGGTVDIYTSEKTRMCVGLGLPDKTGGSACGSMAHGTTERVGNGDEDETCSSEVIACVRWRERLVGWMASESPELASTIH
jgi:hypothetical protein